MVKGIEKLREKLPGYPGKKLGSLGALMLIMLTAGLMFQLFVDVAPRLFPDSPLLVQIEPILPILGSIVIASIGLTLVTSLWRKRVSMQEKYGALAYQKMLPRGICGVWLMVSINLHALISVRSLPPGPPVNDLTIAFSRSILPLLGLSVEIDLAIRICLATVLVILGFSTLVRAGITLGIDRGILVYVYFPEESEIQEHAIYSVIRHPIYFGGVLLGGAAFALRFSLYSFVLFILLYFSFRILIYVEEEELQERFGDGYKEYMSKVPRLCARPRNFRTYIKFLRGKE